VVAERGWVGAVELERLTGTRASPTVGRWVVSPAALEAAQAEVRAQVDQAGSVGLDLARLDERQRATAEVDDALEVRLGRVRRPGSDPLEAHPYVAALDGALFRPPSPAEAGAPEAEVQELVRRGLVVREGGLHFSPRAVDGAAGAAAALLAEGPEGFTVAEFRLRLGTSRRFALALLACLDRDRVTTRRGDRRVAGPLLESAAGRSG
jgi:selenocysteine-specific elongation factor